MGCSGVRQAPQFSERISINPFCLGAQFTLRNYWGAAHYKTIDKTAAQLAIASSMVGGLHPSLATHANHTTGARGLQPADNVGLAVP